MLLNDLLDFAYVAGLAWLMSHIERERFSSYGLPIVPGAGRLLLKGGVFWCLTLRRTGCLWFAVGFYAVSDYADMIVFAEPNSGNNGQPIPGHFWMSIFMA